MKNCWRLFLSRVVFLTISVIVSRQCFKQKHSPCSQYEPMTTAAVEVVGAVCRRLTWSKYLFYFKHFVHVLLTGIAEQKLAVRYTSCAFVFLLWCLSLKWHWMIFLTLFIGVACCWLFLMRSTLTMRPSVKKSKRPRTRRSMVRVSQQPH